MNKFIRMISLTLGMMFISASGLTAQDYFLHTVTKGQGLYSISKMYGVSEDDIIKYNPGSERLIIAGQSLKIPQVRKSNSEDIFHTVKQGETLYRLSVEHRVSVKEICDANPGLDTSNFRVGQVIRIPAPSDEDPLSSTLESAGDNIPEEVVKQADILLSDTSKYKAVHTVEKKETIYKICKKYGISQAQFFEVNPESRYKKLQVGMIVNIPFSTTEQEERNLKRKSALNSIKPLDDAILFSMNADNDVKRYKSINAVLMLPFQLDDSVNNEQKKMVEFYQGVLLALDKLKEEGVSVDLKVIDTKGEDHPITPLLESREMKRADIIFGPKFDSHITEASEFSQKHNIPLVLPINSNADDFFNNPNIYQLNTPQSYFLQEIYDHFLKQFTHPHVVILESEQYNNSAFIKGLKQLMDTEKIPYITLPTTAEAEEITDSLKIGHQNIFILNTPNSGPLIDIIPVLQLVNREKAGDIEIHLFGYPEYQIYASDHLNEFFEIDTYFYSWFYTNNTLQESIDFHSKFRKAFSRQMMVSYPNFAEYGYDMAYFFLKGMAMYGSDFNKHLNDIKTSPVQMGFKFERVNNWGGFINKKVFFVHLTNDYRVIKIDFDR